MDWNQEEDKLTKEQKILGEWLYQMGFIFHFG